MSRTVQDVPDLQRDTYPFIDPKRHEAKLKGKCVLVTGGSKGIGKAVAQACARAGASVALVGRDAANLEAAASDIRKASPASKIATVAGDASDPTFASKAVEQAMQALGSDRIHVLVNSASAHRYEPLWAERGDLSRWSAVVDVLLGGSVNFAQAVLQQGGMLVNETGIIISIGSDQAYATYACSSAYGAAKAGLLHFHQSLELECRRRGILNYYLVPGIVETESLQTAFADPSRDFLDEMAAKPSRAASMEAFKKGLVPFQSLDLAGNTAVALCVEEDAVLLSGTFVDARQRLDGLIAAAREGRYEEGLYRLSVGGLDGLRKWSLEN